MSVSPAHVVILPGDGIGPDIIAQAQRILALFPSHIRSSSHLIGGAAIDDTGSPLPDSTLSAIRHPNTRAILLGAVGGPKWDNASIRPEHGLLALRKELDVYANLRPIFFPASSCRDKSPLKSSVLFGFTKCTIIRELVSGIYFGDRAEAHTDQTSGQVLAHDTMTYTRSEIQRITRLAGNLAMQSNPPERITLVDKANVLASSRLWRSVVTDILTNEYPSVPFSTCLVDSAAMILVKNPAVFNGILLTENMFGDILSDEASIIPGSLGLMPSASVSGIPAPIGLYEPIHGSAPDLVGKGTANPVGTMLSVAMMMRYSLNMPWEAELVEEAVRITLDKGIVTPDLDGVATTIQMGDAIVATLETLLATRRRPMNICEKILTDAAIDIPRPGQVRPGEMICVKVDWTLASELTWKGMEKTFDEMGRPTIHNKDRFWLAIDHTVDPRINHMPKPRGLIEASERFAKEAGLTNFFGPNQTILHTEFCRQRAQPGQIILGADSHSCSAGNVGAFAVGLGAADVTMPMCTGETWLTVPEVVNIRFVGKPKFGIGGKDTILYVLGQLKRNTVAFERAVEFTGPGLSHLSVDARFAIANMTTEFGGIAGVFEADAVTAAYLAQRPDHNDAGKYFRADKGAQYAAVHEIDLSQVDSLVALYPSPDNVVPVDDCAGTKLDGCFIGACTTAEEDLILGGLVLRAGLMQGMVPTVSGQRKVTPGSIPIVNKLKRLGLIEVYERAGFQIGSPGCSFCLGVAADVAGDGEVWLSSQNRNFRNRMGPGSIANLASAATVAASSFDMKITNPETLLQLVNEVEFRRMCTFMEVTPEMIPKVAPFTVVEPKPDWLSNGANEIVPMEIASSNGVMPAVSTSPTAITTEIGQSEVPPAPLTEVITGRAQVMPDNVDTDQIIPAQFMPGTSDEDLGTHCFQYYRPEFRDRAKAGFDIVVAGNGFGSGSSREEAPRALKGCGIRAVIAKGYAFIYRRNQSNMALLGVIVRDNAFYELIQEGTQISIDVPRREVRVGNRAFPFELSEFEEGLVSGGGVTDMYRKYGKRLFRVNMTMRGQAKRKVDAVDNKCGRDVSETAEARCSPQALAW